MQNGSSRGFALGLLLAAALVASVPTPAAVPELYSHPQLQSPVRGEPDDLLMIPGHGFVDGAVVVYRSVADTTAPLHPPESIPSSSSAVEGVAEVVSCATGRLIVRLPSVLASGRSYGLWVQNPGEAWSEGILINDARPMWITPDVAFENAALATLPRELKVVGRNLEPAPTAPGGRTQVRLVGPVTHVLESAGEANPALEHYVARVSLPAPLEPGVYAVEVSRDGTSWVTAGRQLAVSADPPAPPTVSVTGFGTPEDPCQPDDGVDDARCIQDAADAAGAVPGGATVVFPAGRWDLRLPPDTSGPGRTHGIVVPQGVGLEGQGLATRIVRTADWGWVPGICEPGQDDPCVHAVMTLEGGNRVSHIHFDDEFPDNDFRTVYLQLGKRPWWATPSDPTLIEDVTIVDNRFTDMFIAIGDGNFPLRHVYIVGNELEAYRDDVILGGNSNLRATRFNLEDSIVAYNDFYPGDYYAPEIVQGVIASQIGGSQRLDLSHNTLHRFDLDMECGTKPGGCGWRAGHFWHMNNNHEMMLVSQNHLVCTGDKAGDGEAIVYDNNQNEPGFQSVRSLIEATPTTVTVQGPWFVEGSEETGDDDYYSEHWVQIVDGKGLGQTRKIEQCCCGGPCIAPEDSACGAPCESDIRITVSPPWDVVPEPGQSRVTVLRENWQIHVVDNEIDIRGCDKDNPTQPRSGVIFLHGNAADSAVEGNTQYESDGVWLAAAYSVDSVDPERNSTFTSWARLQYFNEVRGNTIEGEYNFDDCLPPDCPKICCKSTCCPPDGVSCIVDDYCTDADCCSEETCCVPEASWSGVELRYGQYPLSDGPVLSYGVSVSHNTVGTADALRGGAIAVDRGWYAPPTAEHALIAGVIVQHNDVHDVERLDDLGQCLPFDIFHRDGGAGIHLQEGHTHDAVLYANTFTDVCYPIVDGGIDTLILDDCPGESECDAGAGCTATDECVFVDAGAPACVRPDDSVLKCPPFHTMQIRRCFCSGATCPLNDDHLVCVPDPDLPACAEETECGPGCGPGATCFYPDTGEQACVRSDQTVFACPDGETIHIERCLCSGPTCPVNDNHLVCRPAEYAAPSGPGAAGQLAVARSQTAGKLSLSWSASCSGGALDYGIYEGRLGEWDSHEPIDCSDAGDDLTEEITPEAGDTYYLVVPNNVDDDGSFGTGSDGNQRSTGPGSCRLSQDLSGCP